MHLHLTPDCELSVLNDGTHELQSAPVSQLISHFMSAKTLTSRPPPEWRRIRKSRQKPYIVAFQHIASAQVIVAYQNPLGEIIFIAPAGF
jgi:hypothetical protein